MKTCSKQVGPARALSASQVKVEKNKEITEGDIPRSDADATRPTRPRGAIESDSII
ncbi:MAG TPA: hypothetical protein VGA09_20540 [Candidatus Binatia bacterium]